MTDLAAAARRIVELGSKATAAPWHFMPENAGLMPDHGYGLLYGEADSWGWEKNLYISVGCSGNVRDKLGEGAAEANADFIAHARNHAPALAADYLRLREVLRPFAEAAQKAEISGRPPFEFVGADDYERALAALDQHRTKNDG